MKRLLIILSLCHTSPAALGKTLLWTAVVAGGLTVVKVSDTNSIPSPALINLSFYLVVVCGILSFLRAPKSFDVWFPTGMNVFISAFLGLVVLVREPKTTFDDSLATFYSQLAIGGIPYGIFLPCPSSTSARRSIGIICSAV